ncbi:c-type cytochrome [Azotobacter beijerinckii]|uniref:Cytochrome c556 n=1 Tax=Azotobacter beijerinckii TaxID=170623 RepID=A0A1I4A4N5_9GAMM|nr:cytochrome c [Azotobacter beijerinckii]SFA87765.1 Cytochrome c556 [Azotobacter beijerinckii]SFK51288.1 Cytochrome c556 [Azotobacter beijerinckii]
MMNRTLPIVLLAVLGLSACGGVDPDSPLGKRQAIFKDLLRTGEELGGMLRGRLGFDARRFAAGAVRLDELARQPWQHFPQVREAGGDSAARDAVWQRQERFRQLAGDLERSTASLVAATAVPPLEPKALAPSMQRVEDACAACHREFRAY